MKNNRERKKERKKEREKEREREREREGETMAPDKGKDGRKKKIKYEQNGDKLKK